LSVLKNRGVLATLAAVILIGGYFAYKAVDEVWEIMNFTNPDYITENYRQAFDMFPANLVEKGPAVFPLRRAAAPLPETYVYEGQERSLSALLAETGTTGFLVARDDTILFEDYFQGETETDRHVMFSVSKSFVSALVGIAQGDGLIDSIEDPITKYVPDLKGSGYDGVKIRDILQMSSGVAFNEDYADMTSDVNRMGALVATGGSLDEFAAERERERQPGTFNKYVSVDTHVLGMLLTRVTGETLSSYLSRKLWQPMGMEFDGYFLLDGEGMELAMGGLNVALRDMARMGRLYLHRGNWNGTQLVPEDWATASVTPSAPHVMPGRDNPNSTNPFGYGYQWWTPVEPHGDFFAAGIFYQYIYVDPTTGIIIAKTSADRLYNDPDTPRRKEEQVVAFQQISAHMARQLAAAE
jgi:CubicO group peptidase (beta-lactamase class C family)